MTVDCANVLFNTKGDFSNKMSAVGNQLKENLKFAGGTALTVGAVGIPAAIALKYQPVRDVFNSSVNTVMGGIANKTKNAAKLVNFKGKIAKGINYVANKIKKMSPKAKVIGAALAIATPILLHLNNKHKINTGKNIQLHKDRAIIEERLKL